ncbi:MAG: YqeG family HAD IIIA-type phosphatase [Prochlorothrix sp.]|nr:YqeG family HAD IIIA-type phosphatase [Prochlorothrix sp.]
MSWANLLQPDLILPDSVLGITPELLQHHQLQGLILDVDDTLVPASIPEVSDQLCHWLETLRPYVSLWLVTNNINRRRIERIATAVQVPYLLGAGKPSRRKLREAARGMNLPVSTIAMVGDRLFTDILAGNRLGMFTILVPPICYGEDFESSRLVHQFEGWLSRQLGTTVPPLSPTRLK